MNGSTKDGYKEALSVRLKRFPDHRYSAILLPAIGCFLYAALLLLFCTRNSPLFVYQSWTDPNIYMDTARAMTKGAVLYRDVFDHKGPLLYLVFIVFSYVSKDTMTGLYLLQSLTLGITLLYLYRMALLFVPKSAGFWICAVFPFFLLNNLVYFQGGGSAEELLLPCFMGGLYYLCASFQIRSTGIPMEGRKESAQAGAFFPLGIFSGIVLAVKLNLTVFFIVGCGFLFLSFLLRKDWKLFFQALWRYALGIMVPVLPCLIYFAATQSFASFWNVYIKFNLVYSQAAANPNEMDNLWFAIGTSLFLNLASVICTFTGMLVMTVKKNQISAFGWITLFSAYVTFFIAIFIDNRVAPYLYIPLLCFSGIGLIGIYFGATSLWNIQQNPFRQMKVSWMIRGVSGAVIIAGIIFSNTLFHESRIFQTDKTGTQQISEMIRSTWHPSKPEETPSILLFNSTDQGFFDETNCIPKLKVFYMPMINASVYPGLLNEQIAYVFHDLADYIIISSYEPIDTQIIPDINAAYVLTDYQTQTIEGTQWYMYLYSK